MQFIKFTQEYKNIYQKYWEVCPQKTADYSFTNLWTWNKHHHFERAEQDNLLWIKEKNEKLRAPVGDWNSIDFTKLDFFNQEQKFYRVPEELANILQEQFNERCVLEEDRDNAEYLYSQEDLANLSGNKFHKKKNHVNRYTKLYGIDYRAFCCEHIDDEIKKDIEALQDVWCEWHSCQSDESLYAEYEGIRKVINNFSLFPDLVGGCLYSEEKLVAFSLGEKLDDTTFVVHFEKAHPEYKGASQAINKYFAQTAADGYSLVNREQDLGSEGLRKAKLTYKPVGFLHKYTVTIKA